MHTQALNKRRTRSISLTPLIDVVFILLMFFMLTSSFIHERQMTLSAPVESAKATAEPPAPQILRLSSNGEWLNHQTGNRLTDNTLNQFNLEQPVVVIPERDVRLQLIVSSLEVLKHRGFDQISLGKVQPATREGF